MKKQELRSVALFGAPDCNNQNWTCDPQTLTGRGNSESHPAPTIYNGSVDAFHRGSCTGSCLSLRSLRCWSGLHARSGTCAPAARDLVASQKTGSFAWVENEQGKRNLWIATPDSSGKFTSKRLTSYDQDDGQEIDELAWTPDGMHVVYGRGGDFEFPGRTDPNPALNPEGVSQNIYLIATSGGEPRKLGEGYGSAISPSGDQVAYISYGQIWSGRI